MECPVCKSVFPKFKEILMIVDRVFYCHHCSSRLISYPDGEGGCLVEDDRTGEKWMAVEKSCSGYAQMNLFGGKNEGQK
jgi:hypothetical protein